MRTPSPKLLSLALLLAIASTPLLAQDWAKAMLEKSPRHREYVSLKHSDRTVQAFVVYPEVSHKAPVVVLIHEIFGLSDWAKEMADELAAQGFIVIAPDLLTGVGPNGGGSDSMAQDAVTKAVSGLPADQVLADLDAAADYGKKIPAANGKLFVTGYCWGGGKSFAFATHRKDLSAAFVFYGTPPSDVTGITAPVYGFYAGNDMRVDASIPGAIDAMKAAGKKYEPITYEGAGHGFMRAGEDPGNTVPANKTARDESFKRLVSLINKLNAGGSAQIQQPSHGASLASKAKAKTTAKPAGMPLCHDMASPSETAAATPTPATMEMAAIM
jgi:carboxymethylenebutenolidase